MATKHIVFYACVTDDDEAGIFVDHSYLGGIVNTDEEAECLERSIINDRHLPGAKFCKKYKFEAEQQTTAALKVLANKQFCKMAKEMYEVEDMQIRKAKR